MSPLVLAFLFVSVSLAGAAEATSCHYGDARDHYFSQPFDYDDQRRQDESSPFPPDKCRLAKKMEEEIQYLRTLMDKCDRCEVPVPLSSCETAGREGCFESSSCINTSSGRFCGPCPVGYDGNGTKNGCTKRTPICS